MARGQRDIEHRVLRAAAVRLIEQLIDARDPGRAPFVRQLLRNAYGRELSLYQALCEQYGRPVPAWVTAAISEHQEDSDEAGPEGPPGGW